MAEISTNIILDGITLALRSAFPGSHIESNAVKQGLRQPAFIVLLVNAEAADYPAQRKKRLPRFDVLYFPKAGRDMLRGTDMSFQVTDGVLHFLVSYNHFTYKTAEEVKMGALKIEQGGN